MKMKEKLLLAVVFLSCSPALFAQVDMEMKDVFGELESQISGSTPVIAKICYAIAGICFFVGGISVTAKMLKGQEAGKDVGLLFSAMAVFALLGYLCQKFWA